MADDRWVCRVPTVYVHVAMHTAVAANFILNSSLPEMGILVCFSKGSYASYHGQTLKGSSRFVCFCLETRRQGAFPFPSLGNHLTSDLRISDSVPVLSFSSQTTADGEVEDATKPSQTTRWQRWRRCARPLRVTFPESNCTGRPRIMSESNRCLYRLVGASRTSC